MDEDTIKEVDQLKQKLSKLQLAQIISTTPVKKFVPNKLEPLAEDMFRRPYKGQ